MASRRSVVAGVAGVSAGLAPYVSSIVCPGVACTSCFACVGAGGAVAAALASGVIARWMSGPRDTSTGEGVPNGKEGA